MVSSTLRPHFTPGKSPVPVLQEVGWAPGPVWTGGKSRPHRDSIPDRPAHRQSLYRLGYPAHSWKSGTVESVRTDQLPYSPSGRFNWRHFQQTLYNTVALETMIVAQLVATLICMKSAYSSLHSHDWTLPSARCLQYTPSHKLLF